MSMEYLNPALEDLQAKSLYRRRGILSGRQGVHICFNGQDVISFCSNDYLGLASHPAVIQSMQEGAEIYGAGSGASHLICGHSEAHHSLEEALSDFFGRPRTLLFSTGYMANLGVVTALLGKGDTVVADRLAHASLLDASRLSGARLRRYQHADMDSLQQQLKASKGRQRLILSDGVFSMDGDLAPLPDMIKFSKEQNVPLMVDDAHGVGVIGIGGRGIISHYSLGVGEVPILMGTLGKAFGCFGAFVSGSEALIETLIQKARSYIFTTALPAAVAHSALCSLRLLEKESWRREKLSALVAQFRHGAEQLGLKLRQSFTPIQILVMGESAKAIILSQKLLEQGILVSAIRPPTVPRNTARLRITFSANHTESDVKRLLSALENVQ